MRSNQLVRNWLRKIEMNGIECALPADALSALSAPLPGKPQPAALEAGLRREMKLSFALFLFVGLAAMVLLATARRWAFMTASSLRRKRISLSAASLDTDLAPALLQEPQHSASNVHVPMTAPTAPAAAAGALAAQAAPIAPTTGAAVRTSNGGSPASPTPPAFPASLPSPTSPASQASSASPASPAAASASQRFGAECAAHFHVLPGADISGMDLFSSSTIAASPSACCSACAVQGRNCGGAVLVGDKCWLKRQGVADHIKRAAGACDDWNHPRTVTFISIAEVPHFPTLRVLEWLHGPKPARCGSLRNTKSAEQQG